MLKSIFKSIQLFARNRIGALNFDTTALYTFIILSSSSGVDVSMMDARLELELVLVSCPPSLSSSFRAELAWLIFSRLVSSFSNFFIASRMVWILLGGLMPLRVLACSSVSLQRSPTVLMDASFRLFSAALCQVRLVK